MARKSRKSSSRCVHGNARGECSNEFCRAHHHGEQMGFRGNRGITIASGATDKELDDLIARLVARDKQADQ